MKLLIRRTVFLLVDFSCYFVLINCILTCRRQFCFIMHEIDVGTLSAVFDFKEEFLLSLNKQHKFKAGLLGVIKTEINILPNFAMPNTLAHFNVFEIFVFLRWLLRKGWRPSWLSQTIYSELFIVRPLAWHWHLRK